MSLLEYQHALLTLYTDQPKREAFFRGGLEALRSYKLSTREKASLKALPHSDLQQFAQELIQKRLQVARKILYRSASQNSPVVLLPTHRRGPTLFFLYNFGEKELLLSDGEYRILSIIVSEALPLRTLSLFRAYLVLLKLSETRIRNGDLFNLALLFKKYQLTNKEVRTLL